MQSDYAKIFDGLIFSTDTHILKPNEQAFKLVLDYFKLNPKETIFVDDRKKNVAGAKKAGISSILFSSNSQAIADIEKHLGQKTLI